MSRITVITPVFNGIRYISECAENVRSQNIVDLEHLVIDGGSTDGTVERLTELAPRCPQLRFISEKDAGQSDAMNKGIRLARGDIIGIINADDLYEAGAISEAVQFLVENPKVDLVSGDCRKIDAEGREISISRPTDLRLESLLLGWEFAPHPENPSAYFYRKQIHDLVGEFDTSEHYAMDLAFLMACAAKVRMAYVPRLWGNFRWMPGTKTFTDANAKARREAIMDRWLAALPPHRQLYMQAIKIQKRAKRKARHLLGQKP